MEIAKGFRDHGRKISLLVVVTVEGSAFFWET